MAKTLKLKVPKSMKLHKLADKEIETFVTKEASKLLEALPKGFRPIGINTVSIDSLDGDDVAERHWREWSRACCDKRDLIENYVDPVLADVTAPGTLAQPLMGEHFESLMKTVQLAFPKMHKNAKARKKE